MLNLSVCVGAVTTIAGSLSGTSGYIDAAGTNAEFQTPVGIATDEARGVVYIADAGNAVVRKMNPLGTLLAF